MSETPYYHLTTHTLNGGCDPVMDPAILAACSWLCRGCRTPIPGTGSIDLHVQQRKPAPAPISPVWWFGRSLMRIDFLMSLGEDRVRAALSLGTAFGPNGQVLSDWVTVNGPSKLVLRGSGTHAGYRRCDECGQLIYSAASRLYLCPKPRTQSPIILEHFSLVVSASVLEGLDRTKWPRLAVDPLPILDAPLDGFAVDEFDRDFG
jgi:hypothetical protein